MVTNGPVWTTANSALAILGPLKPVAVYALKTYNITYLKQERPMLIIRTQYCRRRTANDPPPRGHGEGADQALWPRNQYTPFGHVANSCRLARKLQVPWRAAQIGIAGCKTVHEDAVVSRQMCSDSFLLAKACSTRNIGKIGGEVVKALAI